MPLLSCHVVPYCHMTVQDFIAAAAGGGDAAAGGAAATAASANAIDTSAASNPPAVRDLPQTAPHPKASLPKEDN